MVAAIYFSGTKMKAGITQFFMKHTKTMELRIHSSLVVFRHQHIWVRCRHKKNMVKFNINVVV